MPVPSDHASRSHPIGVSRRPQQLIVTLFALYGRPPGVVMAVGDLITLMADLGHEHQAVRSALTRLKKRQVLLSTRERGTAGYALNPALEDVFREGDERIFSPRRSAPGDPWLLAAFSVPESQRNLRHRIRRILGQRGFGTLGNGLWVAPALNVEYVRRELEREGLAEFVELFVADHVAGTSDQVSAWWDIDALSDHYAGFIEGFSPVARRWAGRRIGAADRPEAMADYVRAITAWRRLPFLDPGLPIQYLPDDWSGTEAERIFADLHRRLARPARTYASSVLGADAG